MTEHRAGRALAIVVALSMLAAACSGDDDTADTGATTVAPETADIVASPDTEADGAVEETPPPEPAGDPVLTFGFIGPGVGLLSDLAVGQERGLALAIDDINAAGGVLGGPVVSVRADEPSSGAVGSVVDDLLGQGANVFVGPVGSATAADLIPTLAERSLLTCSASATATSLTADGNIDWFARTALRDDHLAGIVADDMMAPADGSPPPATVMIVGRDDVYGNELIGALSAELTARGAAVDTIAYPARRVTFADEAAAVAAAAPDAVVLVSYTEGPNLVNQIVAAGTPVDRILGLDGFFVPRLAEQVFPDDAARADGLTVIGTTGDRALMNRLAQVSAAQDQTSYGAQMYDCAITLALATIVAGTTDPPAVGAQLQGVTAGGRTCSTFAHCVQLLAAGEVIDYDGASGHIAFDAAGDISSARVTTSRVIDGVLQPTSVQDIDLVAQQEAAIFAASVFVTQLQQALKVLGYFEGDITGVYDEATTAAVGALQHDLGLPETGQFDEATEAAMRERLGAGASTLGTSVSQLQQALADRGYYTGPIDGRYSAATIEAVRAFQRDLGVAETGVVDVATLQAIYARGQQTGAASVPTVPPETYPPPPPPTEAPTTTAPKPPPTAAPPDRTDPPAPPTAAPTPSTDPPRTDPPDTVPQAPLPATLFDVLSADPDRFSTIVAIAETAGYGRDLTNPSPLTIFAPTNDAFAGVDVGQLTSDPVAADALLRNLAVEGRLTTGQLTDGETLVTLGADENLVVGTEGGTTSVSGAPIVGADISASNGNAIPIGALPEQ